MKTKSLVMYVSICALMVCLMLGMLFVPKVLAKPTTQPQHTHNYKIFVGYDVENNKAYEIKKCACEETTKIEMANAIGATTATAQSVLDTVENGTTIVLDEGEYGNLYFRKNSSSTSIQSNWAGGNHTFKREIKNVTILGTEGTIVSSIMAEAGTYTPTINNNHSLAETESHINMYISFENLTIKDITFNPATNKCAVELASSGQKVSIDGLTIDGCTVNGSGTIDAGNRLFQSEAMSASGEVLVSNRKNITITNNVLNNLHQGVKINYVENLTIKGNEFNNIKGRDMLIGGGSAGISGNINISNNKSEGSTERFIRLSGLVGNLNVTNNVVVNNMGEDTDIVKITYKLGTTPTVNFERNTWNGLNDHNARIAGVLNYPY